MDAALIGKTVTVTIDRPIGSCHPNDPQMVYPINYGFVHGILASDGEEQDVYVLGVDKPVTEFTGEIIAVIHRLDDVEDKWVVAEKGRRFSASQIQKATEFQERYFKSEILMPQQEEHLNASLLGKCGFYCGACPTF